MLGLAGLTGNERIVDAGCGNGRYLERLAGADVIGFDLSPGMAAIASAHAPVAVADLQHLPLRDGGADVTFCNHVLYHVPDMVAGARELRRITKPGGVALFVTNRHRHMGELTDLLGIRRDFSHFTVENGAEILGHAFDDVEVHTQESELVIDEPEPLIAYAASMRAMVEGGDLAPIESEIRRRIAADGAFRIGTAVGCFVCR